MLTDHVEGPDGDVLILTPVRAAQEARSTCSQAATASAPRSGRFAYLDTQAALGMIFEVIEPPTGLGEPLRRL